MANPNTAHEPSMEEILASIRQIISEDGDASASSSSASPPQAAATPPAPEERPASGSPYESVVSRIEPPQPLKLPAESAQRAEAVRPQPLPVEERIAAPLSRPMVVRHPQPGDDKLLSPEKSAAVSGSFGALAQTLLQNSRTLEEVVAETLQPMLKSWLDDNLPGLVERMVREEIERVSRGRR
jgi:cell pole-organizing protein PopZ